MLTTVHARIVIGLVIASLGVCGCSRTEYRVQADQEAYGAIAERNGDPRWQTSDVGIRMDPRSRYFDKYNPDESPMPADDPASHQYMHRVDGKDGWNHWHDNGDRPELENPTWRDELASYVEVDDEGAVNLNIDSALAMAYLHSIDNQRQLETLYLSALDVTEERFRLDTQFFGGQETNYRHNGRMIPPILGRSVVHPGQDAELNRLSLDADLQARRQFATAGDLLVGFANSFVFEFTGGDANLSSSLMNYSFIQPLLRGAGRQIALENLTLAERRLLSNLRAYAQYRQGFFTRIAIGELGVTGPQRGGSGTSLQSFPGIGGVSGYLGLLRQLQVKRNSEDNFRLQLRTRDKLEALYRNEFVDLVQVYQFQQSVEDQRSEVVRLTNALELSLDNYKTDTLGLPSSLPLDLDETLVSQFQLFPKEGDDLLDRILDLQNGLSELPDEPELNALSGLTDQFEALLDPVQQLFGTARAEIARLEESVPTREETMDEKQVERFRSEREKLRERFEDLETAGEQSFRVLSSELKTLSEQLNEQNRAATLRKLTAWVQLFQQLVERTSLIPAQARLEMITVQPVELEAPEALRIALKNRLDFMNGRAALVDAWRAIEIDANALRSILNVTSSGRLQTERNNSVSFRAPTADFRLGLEFDAPLTRLLERNDYRATLINYQRNRRQFIRSRDLLEKGLRALLRNLKQQRQQLEIKRLSVSIAMRRVDQTQLKLSEPPPPGVTRIDSTTAFNLLGAQGALQRTQNELLSAWIDYYSSRMRLYREMGIMQLDAAGKWIELPIDSDRNEPTGAEDDRVVPEVPPIPAAWINDAAQLEILQTGLSGDGAEPSGLTEEVPIPPGPAFVPVQISEGQSIGGSRPMKATRSTAERVEESDERVWLLPVPASE